MTEITFAQQVAAVLMPALPYLLKGVKLAGQKAAETLGEETVKALWEKLKTRARIAKAAQAVVSLPDNPAMQDALANEIAAALQADPALAAALRALLGQAGVPVNDRQVSITGNVSGSVINTGDNNTITNR